MKKFFALLTALSLAAVISLGCSKATPPADLTKVLYESGTLCGSCGELKGTEACCAEGAEACSKCQLNKGAPGCCKLKKIDADATTATITSMMKKMKLLESFHEVSRRR